MKSKFTFIYLLLFNLFAFTLGSQESQSYVYANSGSISCYPKEYDREIKSLLQMTEVRMILGQIAVEGKIRILVNNTSATQFGALWDASQRMILVTPGCNRSSGSVICSILFEIHNALSNKKFINLMNLAYTGQLTKEEYVEKVERMEHQNALSTAKILEKGIRYSVFPADAAWDVYINFDDHYKIQQIGGHSQWIAQTFDSMNRHGRQQTYQGTIPGLSEMTHDEKMDLRRYLAIKNDMASSDPQRVARGKSMLNREMARLQGAKPQVRTMSKNTDRRRLMKLVWGSKSG